jgi:hypothetical protein
VKAIAEVLKNNTTLTSLQYVSFYSVVHLLLLFWIDDEWIHMGDSLYSNQITDAGVSALGDALKNNTTLTSLEYVSLYSVHITIGLIHIGKIVSAIILELLINLFLF